MKISEINSQADTTQYVEQAEKSKQAEKNQTAQTQEAQKQQTDRVDLSDQSKEMKKIYTAQQMAPDIRTEQVQEVKILGPNDFAYVPSMQPHSMKNVGDESVKFLCCIAVLGEDELEFAK